LDRCGDPDRSQLSLDGLRNYSSFGAEPAWIGLRQLGLVKELQRRAKCVRPVPHRLDLVDPGDIVQGQELPSELDKRLPWWVAVRQRHDRVEIDCDDKVFVAQRFRYRVGDRS
jgi:hypothetical protein